VSRGNVKRTLKEFITSNNPTTLALTGEWGVGKTYFWQDFIKDNLPTDIRYAYVSLFGINSAENLKKAIVNNGIKFAGPKKFIAKTAVKNFPDIHIYGLKVNVSSLASKIDDIIYESINGNWIICIDDIERKGEELKLNDVLGFISNLNEQKKCRVITIFNDDQFKDADKKAYEERLEKVFHRTIRYEPTATDNIEVVFKGDDLKNRIAKEKCEKLGISNIRILTRIKETYSTFENYLQGDENLIEATVFSCVVLCWSYYGVKDKVVPFEFFKKEDHEFIDVGQNDEYSKWRAFLRSINWGYVDQIDKAVISFLEKGYLIEEEIKNIVSEKTKYFIEVDKRKEFDEIRELYWYVFRNNKDDIARSIEKYTSSNLEYVNLNHLDVVVVWLRNIGEDSKANKICDNYINFYKVYKIESLDVGEFRDSDMPKDPYLLEKMREVYDSARVLPDFKTALSRFGENNGLETGVEEALDLMSEDDLYFYLINNDGYDNHYCIHNLLKFGNYEDKERYKRIKEKTIKVLKRIAGESTLNDIRASQYLKGLT